MDKGLSIFGLFCVLINKLNIKILFNIWEFMNLFKYLYQVCDVNGKD